MLRDVAYQKSGRSRSSPGDMGMAACVVPEKVVGVDDGHQFRRGTGKSVTRHTSHVKRHRLYLRLVFYHASGSLYIAP
jgi:hypothetical protein